MANSYTTPWTSRAYEALPGNPISIGAAFAGAMIVAFFVGRAVFDIAVDTAPGDLRIALTQILITAYAATAYVYLLITARRSTAELASAIEDLADRDAIVERAGKHSRGLLLIVGAASYLLFGVIVTNATTPEPANPWSWQGWSYEVYWHRATTVLLAWWIGCFNYVLVVESARLSRMADSIDALDLLDMQPYQPLLRQGLTNALLVIGMVSVISLLGIDSRYWPALVSFWIGFTLLAWIGLMLPLRGIRRKFKAAKKQELDWCRQRAKASRDTLKSSARDGQPTADVLAYQKMIEDLRNWPFDNSTLVRFTLYLLIPMGSWLGGAFVERGLDLVLS